VDQFAITDVVEKRDCFWVIRANAGVEVAVCVPQQGLITSTSSKHLSKSDKSSSLRAE
jgi:hypothetical protein